MAEDNGNGHAKWVIRAVSAFILGALVYLVKQDHDNVTYRIKTLETVTFTLQLQQAQTEIKLDVIQQTLNRIETKQRIITKKVDADNE